MNKVSVLELKGAALDWAVAAAQNEQYKEDRVIKWDREELTLPAWIERENSPGTYTYHRYSPSTNWNYGGEIIEENGVSVSHRYNSPSIWDAIIKPDFLLLRYSEQWSKKGIYSEWPYTSNRCHALLCN